MFTKSSPLFCTSGGTLKSRKSLLKDSHWKLVWYFKKIAEKLHSITPQIKSEFTWEEINQNKLDNSQSKIEIKNGELENIKGKNFNEVLPFLENLGFNVEHQGNGLIIKKYNIIKNSNYKKIILELSWKF